MSNQQLQNKRLDQLGRALLEAVRVNNDDIEKIVVSPQLFDSIKAQINAEKRSKRNGDQSFGQKRGILFFLRLQKTIFAFGTLIVIILCSIVIFLKKDESRQITERLIEPQIQTHNTGNEKAENHLPPSITETRLETSRKISRETNIEAKVPPPKKLVNTEQIAFKPLKPKLSTSLPIPKQFKSQSRDENPSPQVFYSLAGNWESEGEDLKIVQTEISTADLLALGVNLPIENETVKIKANLLVGADGIARAIKFVE